MKIVSYDLIVSKRVNTKGDMQTSLTGRINGMPAFVVGFATVEDFAAAIKADKVHFVKVIEGGKRTNAAGEEFDAPASLMFGKTYAEATAKDLEAVREGLMAAGQQPEATQRVDHVATIQNTVMDTIRKAKELAAKKAAEEAALIAGQTEPTI